VPVSTLRNRAAETTTGEILAFVDADHVIDAAWASAVVSLFEDERIGAAGAVYTSPVDGSWVQRIYGALRGRTTSAGETAWLGSGNLAVRRAAFDAVGGFDTSLEACEDVDLCQRLKAAGWRVVADPRLISIHLGDPATLSALFRAERWRGRDNLRVSFRGTLALRDLPSAVIPIVHLACAAVGLWAVAILPMSGTSAAWTLAGAIVVACSLSAIRVVRALVRRRIGPSEIVPALLVASTWDAARALALVWPGAHHRPHDNKRAATGASAL
jgi:hypothetical protein